MAFDNHEYSGYFREMNAQSKKYNFSRSTFYDTLLEKERMAEEKKRGILL